MKNKRTIINNTETFNLEELEIFYRELYPSLCVFAFMYTKNLEVAKERVNNVFIEVWEKKTPLQKGDKRSLEFNELVKKRLLEISKEHSEENM